MRGADSRQGGTARAIRSRRLVDPCRSCRSRRLGARCCVGGRIGRVGGACGVSRAVSCTASRVAGTALRSRSSAFTTCQQRLKLACCVDLQVQLHGCAVVVVVAAGTAAVASVARALQRGLRRAPAMVQQVFGRASSYHAIGHRIGLLLVLVSLAANPGLQVHAALLLHHMRRLVCGQPQVWLGPETDARAACVGPRPQRLRGLRRRPADLGAHTRYIVPAEGRLDVRGPRQRPFGLSHTRRGGGVHSGTVTCGRRGRLRSVAGLGIADAAGPLHRRQVTRHPGRRRPGRTSARATGPGSDRRGLSLQRRLGAGHAQIPEGGWRPSLRYSASIAARKSA